MNIRNLKKDEIDLSIKMSEFAFQYELTKEQRTSRVELINPEETWVITEQEKIASKMTVLPLYTYINGKKISMGGVSGVVTWPEYRRQGHVKALLQKGLSEMKKSGQIISYLFPFSIPFYRMYGWELFADRKIATVKIKQIPSFKPCSGIIRRIGQDSSVLNPIYERFALKMNGMLVRDANWWEDRIFKNVKGQIAVYKSENGDDEGYLIYDCKDRKMKVSEFVYLSKNAWRELWAFIANHDSMVDTVEFKTFSDDPTLYFLKDPKVEQKLEAYFMARIVDVKRFLEIYPFQLKNGESIVLNVEDYFCDWNTGTYIIKKDNTDLNSIQVFQQMKEDTISNHSPKLGITCSIQQLTAMLLNYQKPSLLFEFEEITANPKEITSFEQAIPSRDTALYDFF